MTLSLWKFGLLLISLIGANGLDPFPENCTSYLWSHILSLIIFSTSSEVLNVSILIYVPVCLHVCVVVVAKLNDAVTLTCRTSIDGEVEWKFEDEVLDHSDNIQPNGQNLNVTEVDAPLLGEYSCWRGDEMLSSTHLLLEVEEEEELGEILIFHLFCCLEMLGH